MANREDVLYLINSNNVIEFVWGKEPNSPTRHTAIVVKFDGDPKIVIDFSALNPNNSSALRSAHYVQGVTQLALPDNTTSIPSNINICPFDKHVDFDVLGNILKFNIVNQIEKERASRLILDLQLIEMGPYHAKNNNCRAFVRRAFNILGKEPECTDINRKNFERKITALEEEDHRKVDTAKVIGGVALGAGVALGLYASFKAFMSSKPVHENLGELKHKNDEVENASESDDENDNAHRNSK